MCIRDSCRSVHAEANAIIHASREQMIGATLYLVGKETSNGEYVQNTSSCAMCKRMVINAGIDTVSYTHLRLRFLRLQRRNPKIPIMLRDLSSL